MRMQIWKPLGRCQKCAGKCAAHLWIARMGLRLSRWRGGWAMLASETEPCPVQLCYLLPSAASDKCQPSRAPVSFVNIRTLLCLPQGSHEWHPWHMAGIKCSSLSLLSFSGIGRGPRSFGCIPGEVTVFPFSKRKKVAVPSLLWMELLFMFSIMETCPSCSLAQAFRVNKVISHPHTVTAERRPECHLPVSTSLLSKDTTLWHPYSCRYLKVHNFHPTKRVNI